MTHLLHTLAALAASTLLAWPAQAQVTVYQGEGYTGRWFTVSWPVADLGRYDRSDRATSAVVEGERWEVCERPGFEGRCRVLRPGHYGSPAQMGLQQRIASLRRLANGELIDDGRYGPPPPPEGPPGGSPARPGRGQGPERVFTVPVSSVHAVMGPPEQRCWVEERPVRRENSGVPGAVVGALLGGLLGHEIIGHGAGTAGGAVVGAAIGAQAGRDGDTGTRQVERCSTGRSPGQPVYWEVTYQFRGLMHQARMSHPPGPSLQVNRQGEPRF